MRLVAALVVLAGLIGGLARIGSLLSNIEDKRT